MREKRKREHVENYLRTTYKGATLLENVFLEHNALPDLNFEDIDTKTFFLGKIVDYPIIINAMTGGSDFSWEINRDLSLIAKEFNIPMAVGSQTIALCDDEECKSSFKIVRQTMGDNGTVIANLNAQAAIEDVKKALDMIEADAIQLHLNPAQEVVMLEGDRHFRGILDNIGNIVEKVGKPVIVKEVGFGISKEVATKLYNVGVRNIDISGYGGTNFIEIENIRYNNIDFSDLYSWGIPTALALIKCRELPKELNLIASGGIRDSMDIVKSLVIGGNMVGISGEILSYLLHGGYENARNYLEVTIHKMKILMLLLGKKNIEELRATDYKIMGDLKDLINNS
ncbi:isopentenyl-diphosphate delta-isomerase [Tissierella praeacuta DSM 18095]|uniref:Isopentenyl-diphosphate delta-isomerase n=1 Tax=Tissierella praeacuta DSM 18095 TaxID=1123404 RepID=A0A1M4TSV4_9FIRM|nr:type 2 isopentenyl-diphosphate Delta-isomerase [Tissierella praeacuta]SHE47498.1 isopentenyl-diphosphate delta-isomerase [Tissierella praeacuta DSM 18095]SUP04339.1 Isopentenyl-diphosphate delta-isomerase [Tissierella praeacuta]